MFCCVVLILDDTLGLKVGTIEAFNGREWLLCKQPAVAVFLGWKSGLNIGTMGVCNAT